VPLRGQFAGSTFGGDDASGTDFVDRYRELSFFAKCVHEARARQKVAYFHGQPGIGKSQLLHQMAQNFRRFLGDDTWRIISQFDDALIVEHILAAESAVVIPSAFLDFGISANAMAKDALRGLLTLRKSLADPNIQFPQFDFAALWYIHQTNALPRASVRDIFPPAEFDLLGSIADVISGTSWGSVVKGVLEVMNVHLRDRFELYRRQRGLTSQTLAGIQQLDPQTQLLDALPELFAKDQNAIFDFADAPPRVLLIFDSHDSFWPDRRTLSRPVFFQRDEWLRRLIGSLDLAAGIVVLVGGREPPVWDEASYARIPASAVALQPVGPLPMLAARDYLFRSGITDASLREELIREAAIATDGVHPLYLAMCRDVALLPAGDGESHAFSWLKNAALPIREKQLLERFLEKTDRTRSTVFAHLQRVVHLTLVSTVNCAATLTLPDRALISTR